MARNQKRKMIERGKTVLIVLLCACSVFFLVRIVDLYGGDDEKQDALWGNMTAQNNDVNNRESVISSFRKMSEPQMITVGYGSGKYMLSYSEEDYGVLNGIAEDIIRALHLSGEEKLKKVDTDQWNRAFGERFVYIKYPCARSTEFEKQVLSLGDGAFSDAVSEYSDLTVVVDEIGQNTKVLVRNLDTEEVFSVSVDGEFGRINEIIKRIEVSGKNNYVFAYEFNSDKNDQNDSLTAPMFIMPIGDVRENTVISKVPQIYREGIDFTNTTEFTVNLLNVFGFNPNTIRQYSDSDGKLIYVGEKGTLRVSPNGQIEYKALTENDGITVISSDSSVSDGYSVVAGIISLNQNVLKVSGIGNEKNNASLKFTEFPHMQDLTEVKVVMDYFVDNCHVVIGTTPAVEAIIKNGIITEYRITVKAIERTSKEESCGDILSAIDVFGQNNTELSEINEGVLVYKINKDDVETPAVWNIKGE